jgi:hemerythrin-like domain-containing protein
VHHRVIVFNMCASLNILGRTPDHGFDEPLGLLTDCHRRIEKFLELLQRAVREHARAPLDTPTAEAIRNAQRYFAKAAPKHTADEEESLFPRLRAAAATQGKDCKAIARLEGDHEQADRLHAQVDGLLEVWLRDGSLPAERFTELGSVLATLRELYREHIHVEEAEVFPLAGSLLSPSDLSAVGSEMRARRGLPAQE